MTRKEATVKSLLRPLVIVVALLIAVVAAGCGSDDKSSSSTAASTAAATSTATPAADPLGTPKKASGTPIVVGLINDDTGAVTFPEYRQAAEEMHDVWSLRFYGIEDLQRTVPVEPDLPGRSEALEILHHRYVELKQEAHGAAERT